MKKILFILIMFIGIINVNAACENNSEIVKYSSYASHITYNTEYNYTTHKFDIVFYNVKQHLHLKYGTDSYSGDTKEQVKITSIPEGTYMNVEVSYINMNCLDTLMTISIVIPYYNPYYGSSECREYVDKLNVCSSEFLPYQITPNIFESAVNNYKNSIINEPKEENDQQTPLEFLKSFFNDWGIKLGLSLITIIVCVIVFQTKIRKIKHGI